MNTQADDCCCCIPKRHRVKVVVGLAVIAFVVFLFLIRHWLGEDVGSGASSNVEFFLKCITPVGVFSAVLFAMYGDYLKEKLDTVDLEIVESEIKNKIIDENDIPTHWDKDGKPVQFEHFDVYCHHLQVKNLTQHKPLINCRVWLRKIEKLEAQNSWVQPQEFAVPRLMEWSPAEYSEDKRTFATWQMFDFLHIRAQGINRYAWLVIWKNQGGKFNRRFEIGDTLRFTFFATADNYRGEKEFVFEVKVNASPLGTGNIPRVTPADVRRIK